MIVSAKEKKLLFYGALSIPLVVAFLFSNTENFSIYLFDVFYASYEIVSNIIFAVFFVLLLITAYKLDDKEYCAQENYLPKIITWMIRLLILMTALFAAAGLGSFLELPLSDAISMISRSGRETLGFYNIADIDKDVYTSRMRSIVVENNFIASGMASIVALASSVFCVVRIITVISKK